MRFVKLILFITPLVFVTSCDISQMTGNLKIICKGENTNSFYYPKDITTPYVSKVTETMTIVFENRKVKGFNLTCEEWTETVITCSSTNNSDENFLNLDRETGEILYKTSTESKESESKDKFKGFCEKLKNNKI